MNISDRIRDKFTVIIILAMSTELPKRCHRPLNRRFKVKSRVWLKTNELLTAKASVASLKCKYNNRVLMENWYRWTKINNSNVSVILLVVELSLYFSIYFYGISKSSWHILRMLLLSMMFRFPIIKCHAARIENPDRKSLVGIWSRWLKDPKYLFVHVIWFALKYCVIFFMLEACGERYITWIN